MPDNLLRRLQSDTANKVGNLTVDELREIIRIECVMAIEEWQNIQNAESKKNRPPRSADD